MKQLYIFFKTAFPVILLALAVLMPASAIADQAKGKGFSNGVHSTLTALRTKNVYKTKASTTNRTIADTTAKIQSIVNKGGDRYEVKISLPDDIAQIEINIYNILGRKMGEGVWKGTPKKETESYDIQTNGLPEGMYICVVQGKDFRLAEKFIISR